MNPRLVMYQSPTPPAPDVPTTLTVVTPRQAIRAGTRIVVTRNEIRRYVAGGMVCAKCGIPDLLDGCHVCASCARTGAA